MNSLQLTAVVCLTIVLLISVLLVVAWLHHMVAHRVSAFDAAMRRAIWINTWQIGLCLLFGAAIAFIYFHGWCATWRP